MRGLPPTLLCVASVVLLLWSGPAKAYILPADFLARLVADSRRASVRDATLTLAVHPAAQDAQDYDARIYLKRPERMRFASQDANGSYEIFNEGQGALGTEQSTRPTGPSRDLLPILLLPKGQDLDETSARILERVIQLGVDPNVVSLGRHETGVAYIIGGQSWETDKPQLWIDKATFMPVRLLWHAEGSATDSAAAMQQLRLLQWSAGMPRAMAWYKDGILTQSAEVTQVSLNQNLPETLFDVSASSARQ